MTVGQYMIKSCIPASFKGFPMVHRAIELCVEIPEIEMEEVYKVISNEFDASRNNTERRMRWAVDHGFDEMDEELRQSIFGNRKRMTTTIYVKSVAFAIKSGII